jgi:hypothetical protein
MSSNFSPEDTTKHATIPVYICLFRDAISIQSGDPSARPPRFVVENEANKNAFAKMCCVGEGIKCAGIFRAFVALPFTLPLHYKIPVGTIIARIIMEDEPGIGRALECQIFTQLALFRIRRELVESDATEEAVLLYEWIGLFNARQDITFSILQELRQNTIEVCIILYLNIISISVREEEEERADDNDVPNDGDEIATSDADPPPRRLILLDME